MFRTRTTIFLLMSFSLLLLAGTAMAQPDRGEFLILSAQYGTEYHHVDVTGRLKELARHDRTFRVTHESMGVDPDEGHQKGLRIFARGPNGGERMFEYIDGSIVDGAMFRGWGRGEWGNGGWSGNWNPAPQGDFVILTAQYGSERRHVDVTNQLKSMARQNVTFRLDYRTFGIDPDEGHPKALRIFARGGDGQERMFEYLDNSIIDGSQFRGWSGGEWGNGGWSGNWNGGGPVGGNGDRGEFLILTAQYGSERRHVDVTNQLKEMARHDVTFRLDYRSFGIDPDEGHAKALRIYARGPNGRERMFEYRDNSIIDGTLFRGWGRGEWGNGGWSGRWEGEEREERRERQ